MSRFIANYGKLGGTDTMAMIIAAYKTELCCPLVIKRLI